MECSVELESGSYVLDLPQVPLRVLHIKVPAFSDKFRFEWHPDAQAVYIVRLGVEPLFGDPIADPGMVKDHGTAINVVNIWLRGYKARMMEASLGQAAAAERQREALGQRTSSGAGPAFERGAFEGGRADSAAGRAG